jgi:hypothetical protein
VAACNFGFADCNHNSQDGCEINTQTDNNNCGTCGNVCLSLFFCSSGKCVL